MECSNELSFISNVLSSFLYSSENFKKLNAWSVCFRALATMYITDPLRRWIIPTAHAIPATSVVFPFFLASMMNASLNLRMFVPV